MLRYVKVRYLLQMRVEEQVKQWSRKAKSCLRDSGDQMAELGRNGKSRKKEPAKHEGFVES